MEETGGGAAEQLMDTPELGDYATADSAAAQVSQQSQQQQQQPGAAAEVRDGGGAVEVPDALSRQLTGGTHTVQDGSSMEKPQEEAPEAPKRKRSRKPPSAAGGSKRSKSGKDPYLLHSIILVLLPVLLKSSDQESCWSEQVRAEESEDRLHLLL